MQDQQHQPPAFERAHSTQNGKNLQADPRAVHQFKLSYEARPVRAQAMWFEN
jgi:hypothetical protein